MLPGSSKATNPSTVIRENFAERVSRLDRTDVIMLRLSER